MATIVQNYTDEQTAQVINAYVVEGKTVEDIAEAIGKSVRSIVAKLSREGVYQAKAKTAGAARVTKAVLIAQIAAQIGASEESLESLEKANHNALELVMQGLMNKVA